MSQQLKSGRLSQNAGIAIGPILFIVAILAILAAAIAAGSGSFTSGTTSESAKTQSSALIQIGENLKVGMDRIVMEGGLLPTAVVIDPLNTSNNVDLFSPTGGGVNAPSVAMAKTPTTDKWYYIAGPISGFGTSSPELFAVLQVSSTVCAEINNRVTGTASAPTGADLGNFDAVAATTDTAHTVTNWATMATPVLTGVATGCVNNTNTATTGYYYYQILAVQ